MVILGTILGGAKGMSLWGGGTSNRSSRLYQALVETELASDADCALTSTIDPYLFSFSATVREGRTLAEVEDALMAEIDRVMNEPVSDAELAKAIKQTRAQFAYSSESVTDQGYWLGFSEIIADISWFENFMERVLAVTVEDIQRVAQHYFKPARRNVGWYTPQQNSNVTAEAAVDNTESLADDEALTDDAGLAEEVFDA
jgi:zinc protease